MVEVSVIIPTYNRYRTLAATLRSLLQQDLDPSRYEILVVDNNSDDDTPSVVQAIRTAHVAPLRYVRENRQGVHYARNLGASLARGSILYFTDDDMIADPRMLAELLRLFSLDPMIAAATGRVLPIWESEPPDWVKAYCQNTTLSLQMRPEELIISSEDVGVYSCHQAIRKHVLMECGGFNPENTRGEWLGDGETGLNIKLRDRGYKFAYSAGAVTHHVIPAERMTQRYFNLRLRNQGFADAYTWYRAQRPSAARLTRSRLQSLRWCVTKMAHTTSRLIFRREDWRVHRAQVSYHYARFLYFGRLQRDDKWREFVLKDTWLDDSDPLPRVDGSNRGAGIKAGFRA